MDNQASSHLEVFYFTTVLQVIIKPDARYVLEPPPKCTHKAKQQRESQDDADEVEK
jgi:hypothetical protein